MPALKGHGTDACYKRGCRCDECKAVYSQTQKVRRATYNAKHAADPHRVMGPMGRKRDERIYRYAEHYGVSIRSVRVIGPDALDRMAEHARDTYFSTLKWDKEHPHFKVRGPVSHLGKQREKLDDETRRMNQRITSYLERQSVRLEKRKMARKASPVEIKKPVRRYEESDARVEKLVALAFREKRRAA